MSKKLQALNEVTSANDSDLLYLARNTDGTYTDHKIAKSNLVGGGWEVIGTNVLTNVNPVLGSFDNLSSDYKVFRFVLAALADSDTRARASVRFNSEAGTSYEFQITNSSNITVSGTRVANAPEIQFEATGARVSPTLNMVQGTITKPLASRNGKVLATVGAGYDGVEAVRVVSGLWRNVSSLITRIDFLSHDNARGFGVGSYVILEGLKISQ